MTDKQKLRLRIKEKRKLLSSQYKEESSRLISQALLRSEEFRRADSVFIYVSSPDEPDTKEILHRALSDGKKVYVPKCIKKGEMIPAEVTADTRFAPGYMGIEEPCEYDGSIITEDIDLTVIPCVSASLTGERLGHGAAFYDIFLKKVKTTKVCLCFERLLSEHIPTDANDVRMDMIITENGLYNI